MRKITITVRKSDLVLFPAYTPQNSIHERGDMFCSVGLGLVYGLIDSGGFRDLVQKKNLVKGKTQYV